MRGTGRMTCAEFERGLLALADGERGVEASLRDHARRCEACAASAQLVSLLALSPEDRDPVPDPGEGYWASFGSRVTRRTSGRGRGPSGRTVALAAAAVLLALLGGWLYRGGGPDPLEPPAPPIASSAPGELPEPLERRLREAGPDALRAFDLLPGPDVGWLDAADGDGDGDGKEDVDLEDGWWFPETYGLGEDGRRALLEWIEEDGERQAGGRA